MSANTLCPKIGMKQWTCTRHECTCHLLPIIERKWVEANPGKFDGIAEMENKVCPKGVARKHCPYNPRLGCDCGYRKAKHG